MQLFSKLLSQTDVEKRLAVPTDSLRHFEIPPGNHFSDLLVKDSAGDLWPFRCSTRMTGSHPKPVLSAGWLEFVRRKGLGINDKIVFHKERDETTGAEYRIEVKRHIFSLMGQKIWVDVEQLHLYVN